ncbi:unnamed protein product [Discosporangium mesarthrocarpum]
MKALNKSLKWDQISSRPGGGGKKVHYLSATTVLENANSIFGFNGWESTILHISTDFVEKTQDGRFFVAAVTAIVKVALKDGAGHEDVGYAHLKDKDKGEVLERAKKVGCIYSFFRLFMCSRCTQLLSLKKHVNTVPCPRVV